MHVYICPHCLHPVPVFDRDYLTGEVGAVKVDTKNPRCSVLLSNNFYRNAKCSNIQQLKTYAGRIAKELNLSEEKKEQFFQRIIDLKRQHPRWADYKILEVVLNSVLEGG